MFKLLTLGGLENFATRQFRVGVTGILGRTRASPFTTIVWPAAKPERTMRLPSINGAKLDRLILHRVGGAQRQDKFLRLIGADGAFINEKRWMPFAQRNTDAGENAGHDAPIVILKNGAQEDTTGVGIEAVVE